ncbi:MAG TPA: 2-isopropylmalate synthase [Candidatus Binatia bacterium]|nr:2-isopropylmalate synthase [Candidatus Binatia bacterium]
MAVLPLEIFDETLRDGEQQAGLFYPHGVKLRLARRIARTGVHRIDLMPAVDATEAELAATLVREGFGDVLSAATLLGPCHVEKAAACGLRRVILFYAVSDRLLFLRDPEVRDDPLLRSKTVDDRIPAAVLARARESMTRRLLDGIRHARARGLAVDFAAEDASRADPDFLADLARAVSGSVEHFMVCDTVGVLTPERTGPWIRDLRRAAPGVAIAVHFHNDQGLALENTLAAVLEGATMVSGTFRGIGERAGNVALEQVLGEMKRRHGVDVPGVDREEVERVCAELDDLGLRPAAPYTRAARIHVSGIHVEALLQDPKSYSIFPGAELEVSFGKLGGASNFRYLFERVLGRPQPADVYRRLSDALKRRAVAEGRCYSAEEVVRLLDDGQLPLGER